MLNLCFLETTYLHGHAAVFVCRGRDVFLFISGIIPQLIGVSPEKAIKLSVS